MLGKLFNLGSAAPPGTTAAGPSGASHISSLESVQEDIHTRNLLFPDAQVLRQHRNDQIFPLSASSVLPPSTAGNAFDYDAELELEPRDVRVIIMQDMLSSVSASLLYDSQPSPPPPTSITDRASTTPAPTTGTMIDPRRTPTSPRKSSLGPSSRPLIIQPDNPQFRPGAVDRRASVHGRTATKETDSQRAWREYRDELATFSSCIFGNSELMAYKGTSTKVHIIPSESRLSEYSTSFIGEGRGSIGRSSGRTSRLAQSFSSETVPPFHGSAIPSHASRSLERRKILITRLFPVNLPTDEDALISPQSLFSEDSSGYPFPFPGDDMKQKRKKPHLRQKRTPMYAVALIINLPPTSSHANTISTKTPSFQGPSSYTGEESFPSSFGSARRAGWTMVGSGAGFEGVDNGFTSDIEDRMDAVTQRWDVIMRTLTHLQSVVATTLYALLRQADLASPDPLPASITSQISRTPSLSGRRSEDAASIKPPKTNAKLISLVPNCLLEDKQIKSAVDSARTRIVTGLRAIRVVTGQNRWGVWREEARWVAKWAGGRGQDLFLFNLLTGFLATHTEWLQALSPPWYRRRHLMLQKAKGEEDTALPARTIVVAHDKMAARRIIFLLSAFLPTNQQLPSVRAHRPSTSASFATFSQSPPLYGVPILKEEPLRRKINRRTGPQRASHSRNPSYQGQGSRAPGLPPSSAPLVRNNPQSPHNRRPSDAGSITTADLPFPGGDLTGRKISAATTATITPETSMPHFSTAAHRLDSFHYARPGSSSSVAAEDLKRSLARGDSTGHFSSTSSDSRQSSRWSSVISGFLIPRRRESTNVTVESLSSLVGQESVPTSRTKTATQDPDSVDPMAKNSQIVESPVADTLAQPSDGSQPQTPRKITDNETTEPEQYSKPRRIQQTPDPLGLFESPVKTSINTDDGVIDVDVPLLDFVTTSFETAVSSPSSSGYLSTPGLSSGLDAFEQSCRISVDGDTPLNVAGWLQQFHPDFVLQSIPPQEGLLETVKDALRAEPSPGLATHAMTTEPHLERWMDVNTAIVADTTTFSITRVRYRRLVRPKIPGTGPSGASSLSTTAPAAHSSVLLLTPSISPFEMQVEEQFIEEPLVSLDDVLVEAIERVVALNGGAGVGIPTLSGSGGTAAATAEGNRGAGGGSTNISVASSSARSSRSASKLRDRSNSASTQSDDGVGPMAAMHQHQHQHQHHHRHHHHSHHEAGGQQAGPTSAPQEVPRSQCKTVVLSALEEIAREVAESREAELEGTAADDGRGRRAGEKEGVLRVAVRGWLESVELGE